MYQKIRVIFFALPICLFMFGGETKLKIVNNTNEKFKISTVRSIYLCGPSGCPNGARVTEMNKFLGLFPRNSSPITFDWIPRSLDWRRDEYSLHFQYPPKRIDLMVETGATWSFAIAKYGGHWRDAVSQDSRLSNTAESTDLWIKAGASGIIIDKPERYLMQVGPRIYCRLECKINVPPYPDYQLTFTDDASPENWLQRGLVAGQTNVVIKNSTPIDWTVTTDGFYEPNITVNNKKDLEFEQGTVEKVFSFSPNLPRQNVTNRTASSDDGSVYFTFTPKQTSETFNGDTVKFEPFVIALYRVGKDATPLIKAGKSRYRLTKNLSVENISIDLAQSPSQWRFNITLSPGLFAPVRALKDELANALFENRIKQSSPPLLEKKIADIKKRAGAIVETLPIPINITTLENYIFDAAEVTLKTLMVQKIQIKSPNDLFKTVCLEIPADEFKKIIDSVRFDWLFEKNSAGLTPFHLAILCHQLNHAQLLVSKVAPSSLSEYTRRERILNILNLKDKQGRTALHYAAWHGDKSAVQFYLEDLVTDAIKNSRTTPSEMLTSLVGSPMPLFAKNQEGMTPLHYACMTLNPQNSDFPDLIKYLVDFVKSKNERYLLFAKDLANQTPLGIAKKRLAELSDEFYHDPSSHNRLTKAIDHYNQIISYLEKNMA